MVALLVLLGFATGVAGQIPDPIPVLLDSFDSSARPGVEAAYQRVQENPLEAGANGRLGQYLHAYEQYDLAELYYQRARSLASTSFQWLYLLAWVREQLGKPAEAVEDLARALAINPDYLPARVRLAEILQRTGETEKSIRVFREVLSRDSGSALAWYGLGKALLQQEKSAEAVTYLEQAVSVFDGFGAAHYNLAMASRDLGNLEQARRRLELYQKYRDQWPPSGDTILAAVKRLKTDARERLAEGVRLAENGHLQQAIREHEKVLEMNPELTQAHVHLIRLYAQVKDLEKAKFHYRASLEADTVQAESHYNYGVLLSSQQRYEAAEEAFRKALSINPYFVQAHNNLGFIFQARGDSEKALEHYRNALGNDPSHRLARFNLGRLQASRGENDEAARHFLVLLDNPDEMTPSVRYALSAVYVRQGKLEEAYQEAARARKDAVEQEQVDLAQKISADLKSLKKALERP